MKKWIIKWLLKPLDEKLKGSFIMYGSGRKVPKRAVNLLTDDFESVLHHFKWIVETLSLYGSLCIIVVLNSTSSCFKNPKRQRFNVCFNFSSMFKRTPEEKNRLLYFTQIFTILVALPSFLMFQVFFLVSFSFCLKNFL